MGRVTPWKIAAQFGSVSAKGSDLDLGFDPFRDLEHNEDNDAGYGESFGGSMLEDGFEHRHHSYFFLS